MANGLPTRIGGLGRGIERGLDIGQMLQQREILGQQQILAQKEAEQKETQQRFDNDIRLLDALRSAGASDETLGSFIENKIAPNVDGLLDDTDLTGRGKELANFLSRASADYAKHGDINLFEQVITQGVSKIPRKGRGFETQAQSEGARLAQAADIQAALAGPGREQVLAGGGPQAVTELLGQTELGRVQLAERFAPSKIFAPADLTKYTKDSIAKAEKSGLRSDLEVRPEELQKMAGAGSQFEKTIKLRKEFSGLSKTFRDVRDSFARVQESATDPSAAGDLALIFNFMKMLDPGSVVRESEFATAQNAAGVPERTRALWNRILEGERLSENTRSDFVSRANQLFKRQDAQHGSRVDTFTDIAKRAGLNPADVVIDLRDPIVAREARIQELEEKARR